MNADATQEIRVLVIDDHALFREAISRLLQAEPGLKMIGTCGNLQDALQLLEEEMVDVVLLDYNLGGEQVALFLDAAKDKGFQGHILMVTAAMPVATMALLLEKGASGIFLKHGPPSELIHAIQRVMSGQVYLDTRAARQLIDTIHNVSDEPQARPVLNGRELSVVRAVFEGLTNREIAAKLCLSESAVKGLLQQLFTKTGVRTRSQLVRVALENHSADWLGAEIHIDRG